MNPTIIGILGFQISVIGGFMQLDPTTHVPLAAPLIVFIGLLVTAGAVAVSMGDETAPGDGSR